MERKDGLKKLEVVEAEILLKIGSQISATTT